MSIDIDITRHFAETLALAAVGLGMLALMWGVRFLCNLLSGERLDWLTKCILAGAWLLATAGIAGTYYLGMDNFGTITCLIYAIAAVVSVWLTFYVLLKNIHPKQPA